MSTTRSAAGARRGRLIVVLLISCTILVVELVVGFAANSLALLADAGHVFADVIGMVARARRRLARGTPGARASGASGSIASRSWPRC